jgi:hypothetical protein
MKFARRVKRTAKTLGVNGMLTVTGIAVEAAALPSPGTASGILCKYRWDG